MNITVIGASSGIGLLVVKQALDKGYQVTTLSRRTQSLPAHTALSAISGSATSVTDVKRAISKADAVIVTIGKSSDKQPSLFSDTGRALIAAATELHTRVPFLAITGFGAGESHPYNPLWVKLVMNTILKKEYEDKTRFEKMLADSSLCWEIVRPGLLTNRSWTGQYQVVPELYKGMKVSSISRADVADFLLRQAENPTLLHKYVALTYSR
ncbi:NAD(P)H-binding protein [Cytophagaceae bacterium YF14B1]|uniref:NAD(P)H-binding protein n=1 Tax=Xanthocytophaga flava TaxID=3048013 RepID=A0AAE3QXG4_9BACT|nr:NAD(P)H-binding protein [Xanthocytophaga flavus]MDJ1485006.1 NAD(P)H-binding protein [Xanthocytophaga flavus]